ncbi:hypothetical protein LCGC14_2856550, partial [marine sediment metagenome]
LGSSLQELYRIHRIPYPGRFIRTEEEVVAIREQQQEDDFNVQKRDQALGLTPEAQREGAKIRSENRQEARNINRRSTQFEGNDPTAAATRTQGQNTGRNAMGVSVPGQRELAP